ncbi:S-adenosyl-L-methionine-dependent methyltransferase superfamily protein [Abeliophyllum distichum]|uniref:S-adenosyl-L-methionine-dependent methyltransferase superfamily protein n=1 Tax=Abeliophyllum distichum TaxID=126358 RepID=A0ABD1SWY6_9LAMI
MRKETPSHFWGQILQEIEGNYMLMERGECKTETSNPYKKCRDRAFLGLPSPKCLLGGLLIILCFLLFSSLFVLSVYTSHISYTDSVFTSFGTESNTRIVLPHYIENQISHVQTQLGVLLEQLHTERLAESLSHHYINVPADENVITNVVEYSSTSEEDEVEEEAFHRKVFDSAELRNYTLPKPNRPSGKKKFLGLESVYPSIGQGCARLASTLDRFMTYKAYHMCPDDWDLAQKLMITGCDPLPRRRCFSRTPRYDKPRPLSSSLWTQPRDVDISWSRYKCKNYQCLVSNKTINNRGFYKCSDCFDLTKRGWNVQRNKNVSAEFSIDEILMLKPGEIRICLDFSPTTGTFAALMREKNVTIASATLNLGAPFNEVIASKGLLPLYISVGSILY